jgi:membrane peptidoglycan carboxypeptidase
MGFDPTSHWLLERIKIASINLDTVAKNRQVFRRQALFLGFAAIVISLITLEIRTSWVQSWVLASAASKLTYTLTPGASPTIQYREPGPYDQRLGYSSMPVLLPRLQSFGYELKSQARDSELSAWLTRAGIYPIYHEKVQAGLEVLDRQDRTVFTFSDPRQVYPDFDSIPPLVVRTLLFIENRDLLNPVDPYHNPVVAWDRLARASMDFAMHEVDRRHPVIGGSTLASQLEKMRHSPEGRTHSPAEKFKQITSASLRIYQDGRRTLEGQRRVIRDYLNSIPLSAAPRWGEVMGLADGLAIWYGADFHQINRLLSAPEETIVPSQTGDWGRAYRQVLSLFLALRQPSRYLVRDPAALAAQTDRYLRALYTNGVITRRLRDAALAESIQPRQRDAPLRVPDFVATKASDAIRVKLLTLLGLRDTYALDRLDLTVRTTLDQAVQQSVTRFLSGLADPDQARKAGLEGDQLLYLGDPLRVTYAFTLYERGNGHNLLRVQTDNLNQPLSMNDGTRLQLGSTAKLRTLINYLEIIQQLHSRFDGMTSEQIARVTVLPGDRLTAWAVQYLLTTPDHRPGNMLDAALDRTYSGNPGEAFFTAGGLHYFENFERSEDNRIMTVREGFQQSVNLVFIRLMRDIAGYYAWRVPGASPSMLMDPEDPARERYLRRFADEEGREFLRRFYERYRSQSPDQALETMLRGVPPTPVRLAVIYRSVRPRADMTAFSVFLNQHVSDALLGTVDPESLYTKYGPDKFSLTDRGYLAHVHPLELWLMEYRDRHPGATLSEVLAKSEMERQEVYRWLFRPTRWEAQNKRIRILVEEDAFRQIGKAWQRLGYPFDGLVPSYATAIGVSGDTPNALAELAGILINNGVWYPALAIRELHFAQHTPMETVLTACPANGQVVLAPEIAALVRQEMARVVQNGTGRRAYRAFILPGGTVIPVAGKTGTGDNRFKVFAPGGQLTSDRVVNRTAAFVFLIGGRFYGTVTAFVPGERGANYKFTSALAVQILKDIAPQLMPLIGNIGNEVPPGGAH